MWWWLSCISLCVFSLGTSFAQSRFRAAEDQKGFQLESEIVAQNVAKSSRKFRHESFPTTNIRVESSDSPFPPCSSKIYSSYGLLDIGAMLEKCADDIPAALFPPSYYTSSKSSTVYYPTNVSVQLSLNSLISVDDLQSQYVMDYFIRILWTDPRIVFEDSAWDEINPEARIEGLEISSLIRVARKFL